MYFCTPYAISRKVKPMIFLFSTLLILLVSGNYTFAKTENTWSVSFTVNMSKAVKEKTFSADTGIVYLIDADDNNMLIKLVAGPGYRYSGTLIDTIPKSKINFKFRINNTVLESVSRAVIPLPGGMVNVSVWWNDDPLNITTFIVNMQFAAQYGLFNPSTDSVSIIGTMNGWKGSPKMGRIGTSSDYTYDYILDPDSVVQYKYRINRGDTAQNQLELMFRPNRMVRIPDTLLEVKSDFNNYNPAKRLITFKCNMAYYVKSHRFYPTEDYLDIAGNFNNGGENDVLFKTGKDTVFTIGKYLDTTYFSQGPLTFKFRINGKGGTTELSGKPDRSCVFHDTTNQNPNIYSCFYNNLDPGIPTPPWVYDVTIQGKVIHKNILFGSYIYEDLNSIPEDSTTYRWLRSTDSSGINAVAIDSASKITYTVDTLDIGKWLVFEVQPRAAWGDSAVGKPVRVVSATSIGGGGMGELSSLITRIYPNPSSAYITLEAKKELNNIELTSIDGKTVMVARGLHTQAIRMQIGQLPHGVYFLKAFTKSGEYGVIRVIKD